MKFRRNMIVAKKNQYKRRLIQKNVCHPSIWIKMIKAKKFLNKPK